MRIVIVDSAEPFTGTQSPYSRQILQACADQSIGVDSVMLPFSNYSGTSLRELFGFSLIDIKDSADVLLCLSLPALMIRHPRRYFLGDTLKPLCTAERFSTSMHGKTPAIMRLVNFQYLSGLKTVQEIILSDPVESQWLWEHHGLSAEVTPEMDTMIPRLIADLASGKR